jgi:hypothetical protein
MVINCSDGPGIHDYVIPPLAAKPPLGSVFVYDELASGRMYVESDPIGLQGGSYSTYAYVRGNPISRIDLRGLIPNAAQCKALIALVEFDAQQSSPLGTMYSANYNAFSFSDPMLGLNTAFESIGGPVNIDWMLRSAGGGLGYVPGLSMGIYGTAKAMWNLMNGNSPTTNINAAQNINAPTAALYWLQNGIPLSDLFAPALKQCRNGCGK